MAKPILTVTRGVHLNHKFLNKYLRKEPFPFINLKKKKKTTLVERGTLRHRIIWAALVPTVFPGEWQVEDTEQRGEPRGVDGRMDRRSSFHSAAAGRAEPSWDHRTSLNPLPHLLKWLPHGSCPAPKFSISPGKNVHIATEHWILFFHRDQRGVEATYFIKCPFTFLRSKQSHCTTSRSLKTKGWPHSLRGQFLTPAKMNIGNILLKQQFKCPNQ